MATTGKTKSPVRAVDPTIRALNTIAYGIIVHFGTMLAVDYETDRSEESCNRRQHSCWPTLLLLHEYWIYLQHANVLGNPLCQRLDRQYGIALLRSNQHWSIAGTLSAYWCRETISLFLCLPFLSRHTQYLVLYSMIYHTIKSRGIRKDAIQRYSSTFGIMRQVIDKFYLHSTPESIVTVVRLMLQGLDTLIHGFVVRDLVISDHLGIEGIEVLHQIFAGWVSHAAFNQYFLCSTATFMVQTWCALSNRGRSHSAEDIPVPMCDTSDEDTESDSGSQEFEEKENGDKEFVVRSLLRPGRVSELLKGRRGAASSGVDTAIRIETVLSAVAATHIVGFSDIPLRILLVPPEAFGDMNLIDTIRVCLPYSWLLLNALTGILLLFSPASKLASKQTSRRWRFLANAVDVSIVVAGSHWSRIPLRAKVTAHFLGALLTAKSFLKASKWSASKSLWHAFSAVELGLKIAVGRWLVPDKNEEAAVGGAVATVLCAVYVALFRSENRTGDIVSPKTAADVAFLGHPAELHDCWALWLLPYSLESRWERPLWTRPLWPIHFIVGFYTCNWRQKLFGDEASFFCCDDVSYGDIRMQTWTSCHFGRHFFTSPGAVKRNIVATARHAERSGLKVLTLGALNKAEGINRGGTSVAFALGPQRKLSIIHGNHLTAAAVVETTRQCFGEGSKVFLTGASSKVGWAVAQALKERFNYNVLCHSSDEARRAVFQKNGFCAASTLEQGVSFTNFWIVGKYDLQVSKTIPQGSIAIVFAVPHPLQGRRDIRVIEAGTLHIDLSRFDRPRRFTNKLASHEIFACHAAGIVAAHRLKHGNVDINGRIDELGPVDPRSMDSWLEDAKQLGFTVPSVKSAASALMYPHDLARFLSTGMPPVVVVGAGPSGLAVAASLRVKGIPSIVLEEQRDHDSYGSWDKHFSGLEVTSRKQFCVLPGYSMNDRYFPGEYLSASQYKTYLRMYAERFQLDIRRGHRVKDIVRGEGDALWVVQCEGPIKSLPASAVVVATGKHRVPRTDVDNGLLSRLQRAGIQAVHSTDMREPETWEKATKAAQTGRLCIVGFGNSAADIATAILETSRGEKKCVHIATRTVPAIFPRQKSFFRIDEIGSYVRLLPSFVQEKLIRLLWWGISDSATCDAAFPSHLPRWKNLANRVPVIDKFGVITRAIGAGHLIGHGPIADVLDSCLEFRDDPDGTNSSTIPIDFVIMATGYQKDCIVTREDRLNGLFLCGFGTDNFLPICSIGEEASAISKEIEASIRKP